MQLLFNSHGKIHVLFEHKITLITKQKTPWLTLTLVHHVHTNNSSYAFRSRFAGYDLRQRSLYSVSLYRSHDATKCLHWQPVAPTQFRKWGTHAQELLSFPPFFGSISTVSRLVSAFVMISAFWSVSSLLVFYSRCSRALWSRRHCVNIVVTLVLCPMYTQQ